LCEALLLLYAASINPLRARTQEGNVNHPVIELLEHVFRAPVVVRVVLHLFEIQRDRTASLPLTGRTGDVGAGRHGREPRRRAQTPVVGVRAFDTAGAKAGAEWGCEKYQHGNPTGAAVRREPRGCRVTHL